MAVAADLLEPVLCVDLDGTLVRSDLLLESLLRLIKRNPLYLFCLPFWLLRGKAAFKSSVASRVEIDPALLPYHREFLAWLESERNRGRALWLCTAADRRQADCVAQHLGIFTGVLASDATVNLAGAHKREALVARFGKDAFDYCGNERRDLAVWRAARGAIVVSSNGSLARRVESFVPILQHFAGPRRPVRSLLRALRPHQWTKNALLLIPLLMAHRVGNLASLAAGVGAVVAFSLVASAVYVVNDLLDVEADRAHARKSKRPFASGDLSIAAGFALAPALVVAATAIATFLPPRFGLALATYSALSLAYSFRLKRILLLDAIALAGLYTLRIIAGAGAVQVALSFWLLLFSVFLFLSLALVKRYAELDALRRQRRLRAAGRGYHVEDLAILQSFGTASGYLSVLVLALYINSPETAALYHHPKAIWMLCVLTLYWVSRVWMTAHRGGMHEDPVLYALRDRVSLGLGVLAAITMLVAL
ncbi:MAG TPA: UbiA family prenyltransferase [Steroidobacteraceae bacterium]|nr:UbiA family prenyltransferase [Steroidobacteraceae bacterium]